jgi:adenylate kinase family enzyme
LFRQRAPPDYGRRVRRISVVGNSGSGKTTLAREIGQRLGIPFLELDGVFHQPHWTQLDRDEFRSRVEAFVGKDAWVVDGNYRDQIGDIVLTRADAIVWLDLPRRTVMAQVTRRTIGRGLLRRELWNGNRESLRKVLSRDPDTSIIRWAWTQHDNYRARYDAEISDPANAHLEVIRLQSRRAISEWLQGI